MAPTPLVLPAGHAVHALSAPDTALYVFAVHATAGSAREERIHPMRGLRPVPWPVRHHARMQRRTAADEGAARAGAEGAGVACARRGADGAGAGQRAVGAVGRDGGAERVGQADCSPTTVRCDQMSARPTHWTGLHDAGPAVVPEQDAPPMLYRPAAHAVQGMTKIESDVRVSQWCRPLTPHRFRVLFEAGGAYQCRRGCCQCPTMRSHCCKSTSTRQMRSCWRPGRPSRWMRLLRCTCLPDKL